MIAYFLLFNYLFILYIFIYFKEVALRKTPFIVSEIWSSQFIISMYNVEISDFSRFYSFEIIFFIVFFNFNYHDSWRFKFFNYFNY